MKFFGSLKNFRPICKAKVFTLRRKRNINQHLRCVLLPSPHKLANENREGENGINTLADVDKVRDWLTSAGICRHKLYNKYLDRDIDGHLTEKGFSRLVISMFATLLKPFRSESDRETVLFYYTGHGLPYNCKAQIHSFFPSLLESTRHMKILEYEKSYLTKNRRAKGGEIVLHNYGRCDLKGLLQLWTAGWRIPIAHQKNKHLIVVLDSCYSGEWAEDLKEVAKEIKSSWNGCTVTVQSACSSHELTFGRYFTPCFVNFNKPEEKETLQKLKNEWKAKSEEEKQSYLQNSLPTPQVFTTMPPEDFPTKTDDPVKVFRVCENLHITLFSDPGFFKFCYQAFQTPNIKLQELTREAVTQFLSQDNLEILDFKLKTISSKPLALVLVKNQNVACHLVCVQIHFHDRNTSLDNVCKVSLTHHIEPKDVRLLTNVIMEDRFTKKFKVCVVDDMTKRLVTKCRNYVDKTILGSWENVASNWKMKRSFRLELLYKERSTWMEEYEKKMREKKTSSY